MNERGKAFQYTLVRPDGRSQVLLRVSKWRHDWVFTYVLDEPVAAPRGSRLETVALWDNSARNPMNPDPTARIPVRSRDHERLLRVRGRQTESE